MELEVLLSVLQGCILWGVRVVISKSCQVLVVQELHEAHQGMSKMKIRWPKLNQDIEEIEELPNVPAIKIITPNSTIASLGVSRETMGSLTYRFR